VIHFGDGLPARKGSERRWISRNGHWIVDPSLIVARRGDRVYIPTLEELIEACGNERIIVEIVEGRLKVLNTDNVARLWLALS